MSETSPPSGADAADRWRRWLNLPPVVVYKADPRSRVWRVDDPVLGRPVVIKRFAHAPWRQRLAWGLSIHPAQYEMRHADGLARQGLAVVGVIDGCYVTARQWRGWREPWPTSAAPPMSTVGEVDLTSLPGEGGCLATSWVGPSLLHWLRGQAVVGPACPQATVLEAVGDQAAKLLAGGWVFRDLRSANIVLDESGRPFLIDVGSARPGRPWQPGGAPRRAWRTLRMLDHSLERDGVAMTDRLACLARPLACLSPLPAGLAYDKLRRIVLK